MCELFGYSGKGTTDITEYLKVMVSHSGEHPHGWGLATFYGNAVSLEKEAKTAWLSDYLDCRLRCPVEVPACIAHIRLATRGSMSYDNCHPFVQRDSTNRAWTLAHNGTVFESEILDRYENLQSGGTDSERILCHIIHRSNELLKKYPFGMNHEERFRMMDQIIMEIAEHNKLNLLIFDGELLYVHTNLENSLYQKRIAQGVLFATVPLDAGDWEPVPMLQLQAYENGRLLFAGTKHSFAYHTKTDELDFAAYAF